MRARHGHNRLRWTGGLAAALALAAGALIWAAAPRGEADEPAAPLEAGASVAEPLQLPAPAASTTESATLPARESAIEPVQPLAPPLVEQRPAARESRAPTTPTAFASLELWLLQPCGLPAAGVQVHVRAPRSRWKQLDGPWITGETGRLMLPELPAETPLKLIGSDHMGYEVLSSDELTLAPDERREATETVDRDLRSVLVEVRDRAGRPVSDAVEITLVAALIKNSTRTLQTSHGSFLHDGQALFDCMAADSVAVSAELPGFAPAWLPDTPLDRDPLRLELLLDSGFPVEVQVVDEAGRARDVDSVQVRGSPVTLLAARIGPGRYRFATFPEAASGIIASVQGRYWQIDHAARHPLARMVVPAAGALSVTWAQLSNDCEPIGVFIYSEPPGWGWFEPVDEALRATRGPVLFENLAPGEYRVELHCPQARAADRSGSATVKSDATSQVHLDP